MVLAPSYLSLSKIPCRTELAFNKNSLLNNFFFPILSYVTFFSAIFHITCIRFKCSIFSDESLVECVIFVNVQRVYSLDQEIRVYFERINSFVGSEGDYIALCAVGNSDSADVISSELVSSPQSLCPNFVVLKSK